MKKYMESDEYDRPLFCGPAKLNPEGSPMVDEAADRREAALAWEPDDAEITARRNRRGVTK